MKRLKIVRHDRSLRGHVARLCLFTPILGIKVWKSSKSWDDHYEKIRKRFHAWANRVRGSLSTPEKCQELQTCVYPAAMVTGRKIRTCKYTRFCPWCFARQAQDAFDRLVAVPFREDHVVLTFSTRRWLRREDDEKIENAEERQAIVAFAAHWLSQFESKSWIRELKPLGGMINHDIANHDPYGVSPKRYGVMLVHRDNVPLWQAWTNSLSKGLEIRKIKVFADMQPATIANAVGSIFRYPKHVFLTPSISLAMIWKFRKPFKLYRALGACFSNPALKEPS